MLDELAHKMREESDIRDRSYRLTTYENVFVGEEMVKFFLDQGFEKRRRNFHNLKSHSIFFKKPNKTKQYFNLFLGVAATIQEALVIGNKLLRF